MHVRAFDGWLGNRGLFDATKDDVERFLDGRHIGAQTRRIWLTHLGCFYRWAVSEGLTASDPTEKIVKPKQRRTLPRPADAVDLQRAIRGADRRMRCWLLLAAYQGLRCQEIAGVRREDVHESDNYLRVTKGKGDHERILPLHPDVLEALRALPMPRQGWVFLRPQGGPYPPYAVSRAVAAYLRSEGIEATAHQLRHAFATQVYGSTQDLRLTQELLGHQSPSTTAIYTAFGSAAAADAVRQLNFLSPTPDEAA